jgi:16S rRNA C967 or C1407 C5-methylase (RsmB/RsmF family)/NOL1/NOP2/fmu family ribosome biogenesis protein
MSISFPIAFETRMKSTLGPAWNDFVSAHDQPSLVSIRINPDKDKLPVGIKIPWSEYGFYLPTRPVFTLDPALHAGKYYVQEASSMFLEQAIKQTTDLTQSLRVLDLCAAPGGKSTHLLSLLNQNSLLISNEVIRSRAQILSENIQKWGHSNALVTNSDPAVFQKLKGYFDVIVVDAPCSGEGLFRKDNQATSEWSEENIALCSQRQRRILSDVWPSLKQHGILIYSTCTYNEQENEVNLKWLAENQGIEFIELNIEPVWNIEKITLGKAIGYRFFPHKVAGEGFFISALRKVDSEPEIRIRASRNFSEAPKKVTEQLQTWSNNSENLKIIKQEDLLIQIPNELYDEMGFISTQLHVVSKGTAVAQLKHEKLIPEHAKALAIDLNHNNFAVIELSLEQSISYLRKDNLLVGSGQRGFALVTHQGTPLGWINQLGNRINNLYPSAWRIRMNS